MKRLSSRRRLIKGNHAYDVEKENKKTRVVCQTHLLSIGLLRLNTKTATAPSHCMWEHLERQRNEYQEWRLSREQKLRSRVSFLLAVSGFAMTVLLMGNKSFECLGRELNDAIDPPIISNKVHHAIEIAESAFPIVSSNLCTGSSCGPSATTPESLSRDSEEELVVCAAWFAYRKQVYHEEVRESIISFRSSASGFHTILVSDTPALYDDVGLVHHSIQLPMNLKDNAGSTNTFLPRGTAIAGWEELAPMCNITIAMDSTTQYCGSDDSLRLRKQLVDLHSKEKFEIAANLEHAPYPRWNSTPFITPRSLNRMLHPALPHGCAIAWKGHSDKSQMLRQEWLKRMQSGNPMYRNDDQLALRDVMEKSGPLFRLDNSIATDIQALQKHKYGEFPRFSYLLEGPVSLIHKFSVEAIPPEFDGDMCNFINYDSRKRMIWMAGRESFYQLIFDLDSCEEIESAVSVRPECHKKFEEWECLPEEPYVCRESFQPPEQS